MTVFFYDKTFEGLLTCVFDAFNRKVFPDKLLMDGDIAPLFADTTYNVITETEKANRVWVALQNKLSRTAVHMLSYAWLAETEESDTTLFRYMCKIFKSKDSYETNFGDEDVFEVQQLAKKVGHEKHYLVQFVRFQKAADEIFFAPVSPRYNVLPLIVPHFSDRFSDQRWVIYDIKRRYGYYYDLHKAEEITLDNDEHLLKGKLDDALMAENEKIFQQLWKGYFNALTIKERINPKLQRQHMPKRFWKYLTEKQ